MKTTDFSLIRSLKEHVRLSQPQAVLAVNTRMLFLYWEIGHFINAQKPQQDWGAEIIKNISKDLNDEFPEIKNLSVRGLSYMSQLALTFPYSFVQPLAAQLHPPVSWVEFSHSPIAKITWSHHQTLLDKPKSIDEYQYYMDRTIAEGWSKRVLANKIEQNLFYAQGKLTNDFDETLPAPQSDLAKQTLKDHYLFDFLSLGDEAQEKDVEKALLKQVTKFLLEMGEGFAFMGQQDHLEVGGQDFYLDLLFFHTRLNSYFIIELKIDDFKPEYGGKLIFYVNATDELLKGKNQNPTIGLLLCKSANKVVAEYCLKDSGRPIGIATYQLLPKEESFVEFLENESIKDELSQKKRSLPK
jgi:predicted nuclease of restriction endonuclease-like (RecB) superfamily